MTEKSEGSGSRVDLQATDLNGSFDLGREFSPKDGHTAYVQWDGPTWKELIKYIYHI